MLDTDTVSDLVRRPQGAVAARVAAVGERSICTSVVVASELRFGAAKRGSERLSRQLDLILGAMRVEPLEVPVDRHYAAIRHSLEVAGTPIGPNDLLIAAHARALGLVLVTGNVREFSRAPGLGVEDWLAVPG